MSTSELQEDQLAASQGGQNPVPRPQPQPAQPNPTRIFPTHKPPAPPRTVPPQQSMYESDLTEKLHDLLFGIHVTIRYHKRRMEFFDSWNRVTNGVVALGGSLALTSLINGWGSTWVAAAALLTTTVAIVDLVASTSKMARTHEILARRAIDLEAQFIQVVEPTVSDWTRIKTAMLDLESDEPHVMRVLVEICYNEVCRERGLVHRIGGIRPIQRWLAQVVDWHDERHLTGVEA